MYPITCDNPRTEKLAGRRSAGSYGKAKKGNRVEANRNTRHYIKLAIQNSMDGR